MISATLWDTCRGIKVDYSKGIQCPEFWVICHECGRNHGPYTHLAHAQSAGYTCRDCLSKPLLKEAINDICN